MATTTDNSKPLEETVLRRPVRFAPSNRVVPVFDPQDWVNKSFGNQNLELEMALSLEAYDLCSLVTLSLAKLIPNSSVEGGQGWLRSQGCSLVVQGNHKSRLLDNLLYINLFAIGK
ncbi:hypothetical protein BDB00DRAFT_786830 [Zychaea mexicana]|uniref:uncharacterized protein n=1 Tax=Zychaea mexicana TaxID=64656 RepID=UPI0022FE5836|nr:uncharacterized protein BDB00DRAFT_786830 [Zychaea mexicana]KAI9494988.1 hypothetical protein BDB00DRAFT_786830 [Zychaea mexicana]